MCCTTGDSTVEEYAMCAGWIRAAEARFLFQFDQIGILCLWLGRVNGCSAGVMSRWMHSYSDDVFTAYFWQNSELSP